tara:strand:- start:105 stop:386 length:282 start_codon:yes stop_codon:yes gene_type:complete
MTTASEIQQLALDVFENKLNYKDNDYIVILNILKENYMKVKGILNEFGNEKEVDSDSDSDDEYFLNTHSYGGSNEGSDQCYTDSATHLAFRPY